MSIREFLVFLLFASACCHAQAGSAPRALQLGQYQHASGAITLTARGDSVDPYFASKALLVAHAGGLDVSAAALRWIAWLRMRQLPDGHFERYALRDGEFVAYAAADADDAMLAVWIELLSKMAPINAQQPAPAPPELWLRSLELSARALDQLLDAETGVYHVSQTLKVGLLMDNVEAFSAWAALAQFYRERGDWGLAQSVHRRAEALQRAIDQTFWQHSQRRYQASTQPRAVFEFYPDGVAQFYPLLGDMPNRRSFESTDFNAWLRMHRDAWRAAAQYDFPWGLIAVAANRAGTPQAAACWLRGVDLARARYRWNVLEEAAYQRLHFELSDRAKQQYCDKTWN